MLRAAAMRSGFTPCCTAFMIILCFGNRESAEGKKQFPMSI
jgi:hypothetical protein